MEIGRNALCPCGSGKKYKKCCLEKIRPPVDLLGRRLADAYDRLMAPLFVFARDHLADMAMLIAAGEFLLWPETDEDPADLLLDHMDFFLPWFLFNWTYDPDGVGNPVDMRDMPAHQTIAGIYADRYGDHLDSLQKRIIAAVKGQPFSFLEVIRYTPGHGLCLRDVLTGLDAKIPADGHNENMRPGDILLGRIAHVNHTALLAGYGSAVFSSGWKPEILAFRKVMKVVGRQIDFGLLIEYDFDIRRLYFTMIDGLEHSQVLKDTDGDTSSFHTAHQTIEDPQVAGKSVTNGKKARVSEIKRLIKAFGRACLDGQHTEFALKLCDRIGRMRKLNIQRGRLEIWAAAIVYVIAQLNFLFDPAGDLSITADEICGHFSVIKSTVGNKATGIEKACRLDTGNPDFCRPEIVDMATFYETPHGFIVPKGILSEFDGRGFLAEKKKIQPEGSQSAEPSLRKKKKAESSAGSREKTANRMTRKKKAEAPRYRQLKLFDDA